MVLDNQALVTMKYILTQFKIVLIYFEIYHSNTPSGYSLKMSITEIMTIKIMLQTYQLLDQKNCSDNYPSCKYYNKYNVCGCRFICLDINA